MLFRSSYRIAVASWQGVHLVLSFGEANCSYRSCGVRAPQGSGGSPQAASGDSRTPERLEPRATCPILIPI